MTSTRFRYDWDAPSEPMTGTEQWFWRGAVIGAFIQSALVLLFVLGIMWLW